MQSILICPHAGQPRFHKRERSFHRLLPTKVAAFDRPFYRVNPFGNGTQFLALGSLPNRRYLSRLLRFPRAISQLKRFAGRRRSLMYDFGFDCYLMGRMAGFGRGFIEVGDIRAIDQVNPFVHSLERWVLRDCLGLIVTSPAFIREYYHRLLPRGCRTYCIENKLPVSFRGGRPPAAPKSNRRVSIGLVGMFRFRRINEMLIRWVKENPGVELVCHGDGPDLDLIREADCDRIRYNGPFRNPDDLPYLYAGIDVNFVVYDTALRNVRLLMPNKFYESGFFGVPLLVAADTELARRTLECGIGAAVHADTYESFASDMEIVQVAWANRCRERCLALAEDHWIDDGDEMVRRMLDDLGVLPDAGAEIGTR